MIFLIKKCHGSFILLVLVTAIAAPAGTIFDVRDFGATGSGSEYDTPAVQAAIEAATTAGGGTVYFPAGKYLIKTVRLKSNVGLYLERGAILLGSTELYRFDADCGAFVDSEGRRFGSCLIFANEAQNISISGYGTIDGQGYEEFYPVRKDLARPSIIRFIRCRQVTIENVSLIHSAAWVQHYIACDDLTIDGITVDSYVNKNNDGLDIESCQGVIISRCRISSGDDAVVLKTLSRRACRDVVISDCIISSLKSAIKIGTESIGDFENISVSNCVFYGSRGISLLSVDGGAIRNVTIANISMRDSYAVLVIRLGNRLRPYEVPEAERPSQAGVCQHIMIHNVQAMNVTESNDFICGIPDAPIEDVTISNLRIHYKGGGLWQDSDRHIPELTDEYPKAKMFGVLPSSVFFIRHARNVTLRQVEVTFTEPDHRSALVGEDVAGLQVVDWQVPSTPMAAPFIQLHQCHQVHIRHARPMPATDIYLQVTGDRSREITVSGYCPEWARQKTLLRQGAAEAQVVFTP